MMRDRVAGWWALERITTGAVHARGLSMVCATRWMSPTGTEATLVTGSSRGGARSAVPTGVSSPALARDAGLRVGDYVLDPQLAWFESDDRRGVVSPALGLRLSVRAGLRPVPLGGDRFVGRPCRARFEAVPSEGRPAPGSSEHAVWPSWTGSHPAVATRWPVPTSTVQTSGAPAPKGPRGLVAGPAAFLRDDVDDPVDPVAV